MLLNPFALEIEAAYKQHDATSFAARERAGRAATATDAVTDRPAALTTLRAAIGAARDGLAVVGAWLQAICIGRIVATRRRPVA